MSVLPQGKVEKVEFCEQHEALWTTNATAIGTTTTAVTDLTAKTTAARAAFNAQKIAQDNAKSATLALAAAVDAMTLAASGIIKSIKTKAATAGDGVYTLANIPAPATPGPVAPLGQPNSFSVELGETGALTLKWKNTNPKSAGGAVYQVFRRDSAAGEFKYLGGTGQKKFIDYSVPAGSSQVTYQIQAVRSSSVGPWAQYNVNFGTPGEPVVTQGVPVKIAA